ncbi:hypothetical protein NH340_JMT06024 [Sarcoptes scabiei]|nr:hypothetical protein NH340_JMT06024 [Sarcoptes scabiei]
MGRKVKIGKQRKDRYYQLAKETGFRSRAAFKLIQLNRKFEFLQRAKVLVDLCAAPGGWLQVAQQNMPVSSVIIGIDLVPIRPIPNVMTLQEDITTQKCRTLLKKNLQTWKADVFLNDGAPNVGKSWLHDAFEQNRLTLSALSLACEFLMKGGWFVTKIFRSKDYNSLIWVFNKLFRKVFATKPLASRNESAEIFVVCKNYLAPSRIDPKLFDPSFVFADADKEESKITINSLLKASTNIKKPKAEGYEDGQILLYRKLNASEFIDSSEFPLLLSKSSEIVLDDDFIKNHPSTTSEIQECIKDTKVLGKKELMLVMNWRKAIRKDKMKIEKTKMKDKKDGNDSIELKENKLNDISDDGNPNDGCFEEIDSIESEEAKKLKKLNKKEYRQKKKMMEKMNLKMVHQDDQLVQEEEGLFSLNKLLRHNEELEIDVPVDILDKLNVEQEEELEDQDDSYVASKRMKSKRIYFNKDDPDKTIDDDDDDDDDSVDEDDTEDIENNLECCDEDDSMKTKKDLTIDFEEDEDDLDANKDKHLRFFDNPLFKDFGSDEDECDDDDEIQLEDRIGLNKVLKNDGGEDEIMETISESDQINNSMPTIKEIRTKKLSKEELAIAKTIIKSAKSKRDLMDDGWNRFMHNDLDVLPTWFKREEQIHCRKPLHISQDFPKKSKTSNISKINKKELEAKARKKKRISRKMEKAREKAEHLTDDPNMSNKEKIDCIRRVYKKASSSKIDKRPKLVVAKRQYGNRRPPGVKGRYKIVDSRMKKDKRNKLDKKSKKNGGGKRKRNGRKT